MQNSLVRVNLIFLCGMIHVNRWITLIADPRLAIARLSVIVFYKHTYPVIKAIADY